MGMGMRAKISPVFFLFSALLFVSVTLAIAQSTIEQRDPELDVCKHQCDVQQGVGERQKEQCKRRCERYHEEKKRREEEQQQEGGGGESESNNPYVFEDRHFSTQLKTQHGRIRVLQKFTDRSELFRGIENFRVVIFEAEPQTFIVPNHWDADALFIVANGKGTISLVFPEKRESFNIRRGDIFRVPAGITAYLINRDNSEKLVLAKLVRPISTPGEFEAFFGPAAETPESSFYSAFSTEILEAALNTRRDRLERLFRQQREGVIKKASEEQIRALSGHDEGGSIWPFGGGESRGVFNLFEKRPLVQNDHGSLHELNSGEFRGLRDLNVVVSFANITQGSLVGPYYNSKATKISIVLNGEGHFEMACPHLQKESGGGKSRQRSSGTPTYQKVRARLTPGVVFVVPAGHPVATVASDNKNLEVFCFEVNADQNERVRLAGRGNVMSQLQREAQELAFGAPAGEVAEVFESQNEELFFGKRRQQGRAYA